MLPHAELAAYKCCDASNRVPTKCSDVSRHLPPPDICSSEITLADVCRLIIVRVGVRVRVSLLRSELVSWLRSAFRVSVTVRVRLWGYVRFLVRYGWTEVPESDFRGDQMPEIGGKCPTFVFDGGDAIKRGRYARHAPKTQTKDCRQIKGTRPNILPGVGLRPLPLGI